MNHWFPGLELWPVFEEKEHLDRESHFVSLPYLNAKADDYILENFSRIERPQLYKLWSHLSRSRKQTTTGTKSQPPTVLLLSFIPSKERDGGGLTVGVRGRERKRQQRGGRESR